MIKKFLIVTMIASVLSLSLCVPCFADNYDPLNSNQYFVDKNIQQAYAYVTGQGVTVSNYTYSGNRPGIKISGYDQNNPNVYFEFTGNNFIAGKTYIISGDYSFGVYNTGYVDIGSARAFNTGSETEYNYQRLYNDTSSTSMRFTYAFVPTMSNVSTASAYQTQYSVILKATKTINSDFYFLFTIDQCVCLDDIVISSLRSIEDNTNDLEDKVDIIVQYLFDMLYDERQSNNISEATVNQYTFFRWMMDHYPNSIHSDFYDEYQADFFILLYQAILDISGSGEPVTDVTVVNDTSAYDALKSAGDQLKVTDDQGQYIDPGRAAADSFRSADVVISQLQEPISYTNDVMSSFVFSDLLIFAPLIVALALGLLITILGRNKS